MSITNKEDQQAVTPWEVSSKVNYDKLIQQFGCKKIDDNIISEIETLTGTKVHRLIRRGFVFSHRDLDVLLKYYKEGKKFYLYTGRGPSSNSMHIGHAIPFLFCKYLQEAFDVPLVIQITDDEKFLFKNITLEESIKYGEENIKDIIAFGFDPKKTFIFSNVEYAHKFVKNSLKLAKAIKLHQGFKVFGFDENSNLGQIEYPVKQIAPAFSSSFPFLSKYKMCLIPAAIDQDPYFRLGRDYAKILKEKKPASIYSTFLPALQSESKMSASDEKTTIYLSDTRKKIKNKINKEAFSGGRDTLEEHRKYGGNPDIDVSFQYLRYFLEDDKELEEIRTNYIKGIITSGEMKSKCIDVIAGFVEEYQMNRAKVTDEDIKKFKQELDL
ncbi:Tryptophanyl-tRNA synthetase [Spraguea lophii 42_110]|uniref:tryptophan--tRNA ligase n=1 Tax=Spraguea lophii (strain 42_110) TaxID=1358809 RepID=S7XLV7_SPRLO|nr:Tryptophanyl-tRNA synthetase [Spraguea lophii 42_110]